MKNQKEVVNKIIRHEIDPTLVKKTIDAKVAQYEADRVKDKENHAKNLLEYEKAKKDDTAKRWLKAPFSQRKEDERIDKMYDSWIDYEKNHYALVRVIEDCTKSETENRFHLVYGKDKDEAKGTGPFLTLEKAKDWFLKQGR